MSLMFVINLKSWLGGGVLCAVSPQTLIDPFSAELSRLLASHPPVGAALCKREGEQKKERKRERERENKNQRYLTKRGEP